MARKHAGSFSSRTKQSRPMAGVRKGQRRPAMALVGFETHHLAHLLAHHPVNRKLRRKHS